MKMAKKFKRLIDKKPPNLAKTAKKNRKIIDVLMLLAPRGTLKMSGMYERNVLAEETS